MINDWKWYYFNYNPIITKFWHAHAYNTAARVAVDMEEAEETTATAIPTGREKSESPEGSDSGGSPPQLSAHALAALQEFYAEEAALEAQLKLGLGAAPSLITEDWV